MDVGLARVLDDAFAAVLTPRGFVANKSKRSWVRDTDEIEHVISLLKRRSFYDVQWGLVVPGAVDVLWATAHKRFEVGQSVVTGTPSSISHPAKAASFSAKALAEETSDIITRVREDLETVAAWLAPFTTRRVLRDYLLENRDATDRRAFVIPAKLPLKLLTAAILALLDRDKNGCRLTEEAQTALSPFTGEVTVGRLERLQQLSASVCA